MWVSPVNATPWIWRSQEYHPPLFEELLRLGCHIVCHQPCSIPLVWPVTYSYSCTPPDKILAGQRPPDCCLKRQPFWKVISKIEHSQKICAARNSPSPGVNGKCSNSQICDHTQIHKLNRKTKRNLNCSKRLPLRYFNTWSNSKYWRGGIKREMQNFIPIRAVQTLLSRSWPNIPLQPLSNRRRLFIHLRLSEPS